MQIIVLESKTFFLRLQVLLLMKSKWEKNGATALACRGEMLQIDGKEVDGNANTDKNEDCV